MTLRARWGRVRGKIGSARRIAGKAWNWVRSRRRLPRAGELSFLWRIARDMHRGETASGASEPHVDAGGLIVAPIADAYSCWLENNRWNEFAQAAAAEKYAALRRRPTFSIVMPVYNVDDKWLELAVDSVREQVYPHWELCLADDASTRPNVRPLLARLAASDARIKVRYREENGNIAAASNSAAKLASGEFIALLDQDDRLAPDCLLELAAACDSDEDVDVIYSDDDKMDETGRRYAPQFKPDWSPELLLSYMYFTHVFCVRRELFERLGGFRAGFDGCQDYDLALRATERARRIVHVPKVLYHWRALPSSTASSGGAKPEAFARGVRAVQEACDRRGIPARASQAEFAVRCQCGIFQLDFPHTGPMATIVIPTRNRLDLLKRCVDSILAKTVYGNYEVLVVDNDSDDRATLAWMASPPARCRVVRISSEGRGFNFARLNNLAVGAARGEFVVFLNNDTEVTAPDWLSQLAGYGSMPGVGAVGARLLFPDGRVQHAGVVLGMHNGLAGHAFKLAPWHQAGYMALAMTAHNRSAVTAACMLVRRKTFLDAGGFDEERYAVAYNDVDLCLRLAARGLRCVVAPRAELLHHESATRSRVDDPREPKAIRQDLAGRSDPYYNPNLSLDNERGEPTSRRTGRVTPRGGSPLKAMFCGHNLNLEGAPLIQFELAKALLERGRVVPEVHSPAPGPLEDAYRQAGIATHVFNPLTEPGSIDVHRRSCRQFGEWIRSRGAQVVHANTLVTHYAVQGARDAGLPSIWSVHESVQWRNYFQAMGSSLGQEALDCFRYPYRVSFSADATRILYRELESKRHFSTIYCTLDRRAVEEAVKSHTQVEAKLEAGCPVDMKMFTIVGTTCERKGQHEFLQAAIELLRSGRKDVAFFVVGCREGTYLHRLRGLAAQFPRNIRLVGETHKALLYYRASDAFVCCSSNESFPRVILEAMCFGLPIVTTTVFGIAEQVNHDVTALTYRCGDVPTLARHMKRLLEEPELGKRLGEAARHRLDVIGSYNELAAEYERLFLESHAAAGPCAASAPFAALSAA